ncbi:MAG TPA: hypothetical protein VFZ64_12725 [Nocardioidaceae bacterium]
MSQSSTIYTIGTALNRAHDSGAAVQVLVEGTWVEGHVVAVDGFGVVLESGSDEHSVVRVESIAAVTIRSSAPHREQISERVYAMPTPRAAGV